MLCVWFLFALPSEFLFLPHYMYIVLLSFPTSLWNAMHAPHDLPWQSGTCLLGRRNSPRSSGFRLPQQNRCERCASLILRIRKDNGEEGEVCRCSQSNLSRQSSALYLLFYLPAYPMAIIFLASCCYIVSRSGWMGFNFLYAAPGQGHWQCISFLFQA